MKNLKLIPFLFLSIALFSCNSKPEIKEQPRVQVGNTIQNYKFDDDELARRKTEAEKVEKPIKKKLSQVKKQIITLQKQ